MTNDERAAEALDRVRRYDRGRSVWKTALTVYGVVVGTAVAVLATISLIRGADTLQIVKDAVDPHSKIAQRGQQQISQFGDQQAARFDAIAKQRDQELLEAVRSGRPIVFGPTPTLPPTTSTTVQARKLPVVPTSGPRQNLGVATTVPKG